MAAGMTQAPFPPNQEGPVLDKQGFIDPDGVHRLGWRYTPGTSHPNVPTASNAPANVLWQEEAPLTSGVEPSLDFASLPYLPEYRNGTGDIILDFSLGASNAGHGAFVHNPWGLENQAFPSPASEAPSFNIGLNQAFPSPASEAPSFNCGLNQAFPSPASEAPSFNFGLNPSGMDGPAGYQFTSTQSRTDSLTTAMNLIPPNPIPQPADISPINPHPAPKRRAESPARPSRPRTLKRHRSDTPSIASIASISTPCSASTVGSATTRLGGVLPAHVDPRVASEQIRREARERSKAEANEMLQRRMMLKDHEHGALERETQRLQVNLSLMREAARREQAEEEEQAAKAWRAERWIHGE